MNQQVAATTGKGVQTVTVTGDEDGMRLDRFFEARFPGLSFSHIQRIIRKGEVRVNGKRAQPKDRIQKGQAIRVPPLKIEPPKPRDNASADQKDRAFLKSITLFEDDDVMVLNKPMGLSVQGGSGTTRHIDGMLGSLSSKDGQRPRLVHRLDKDTSGCLVLGRHRKATASLGLLFKHGKIGKTYWAVVEGGPAEDEGTIDMPLGRLNVERGWWQKPDPDGQKAVTNWKVLGRGDGLTWLAMEPVTGRTHQLRVHTSAMGWPIVGDNIYGNGPRFGEPILHLHSREIVIPISKNKEPVRVVAPTPEHMRERLRRCGWNGE
jgi:tRNA pseudouridine32 synthase/23S rRNA pseudouridine746 synthase